MNNTSKPNFKVIIVGGGPVGLVAAHALLRAGIDFTVLEGRPSIVIDAGSNLVLMPNGMRVLSQLGLLEPLSKVSSPLTNVTRIDHSGNDIGDFEFFLHQRENHGVSPRIISRHELTKVLYETLPAERRANMFANKRVANITTTEEGVTVTCRDGTSHTGSMVLGADGAHSLVRDQMRSLALAAGSTTSEVNEEQPFETTYRAMWVRFPTSLGSFRPGDANETHGPGAAIQLFAGDDTTVIGVYERMESGPTRHRQPRYTQADMDGFAARLGHLPLSHGLTLGQAYAGRVRDGAGLVSLEEGVVDHWSWSGRIVLAGDAAHKFTPSTAAGCNNGIVDVVVLANQLHRFVVQRASGSPTTTEQVAEAFAAYQSERFAQAVSGRDGASRATAAATWQNRTLRMVDRHVLGSSMLQKVFASRAAAVFAQAPVLDYVVADEKMNGKVPWLHKLPSMVTV